MAKAKTKQAAKKVKRVAKPAKQPHATKPAAKGAVDPKLRQLLGAIWADPDDRDTLRIYADSLAEQGSTRGEYIQLCMVENPTEEQTARMIKLEKDDRGGWLGAARPYIRSWYIDSMPWGFVSHAWVEADKLIAGFDKILELGPRMILTVTSMRKARRDTEARMARLPLGRIYDLDLDNNALDDKSIATLAPALAGIRALHLGSNEITGAGYRALGAHVGSLEFLEIGAAIKIRSAGQEGALVDGIADAIATTPGFRSLRYLSVFRAGSPSPERIAQLKAALPQLTRLRVTGSTEWDGRDPKSWTDDFESV